MRNQVCIIEGEFGNKKREISVNKRKEGNERHYTGESECHSTRGKGSISCTLSFSEVPTIEAQVSFEICNFSGDMIPEF